MKFIEKMVKIIIALVILFSQNISSKEVNPVLIKGSNQFQLNPLKEGVNDDIFKFKGMMEACFKSSELKGQKIEMKLIVKIINEKIEASGSTPTLSCFELVLAYKERI